MDNTIIEQLTVSEFNIALSKTKRIATDIKMGDNKPSWDGDIILYNSDEFNKENIVGKIDVQVKGTTIYEQQENSIKFRVKKSDLLNIIF